MRSQKPGMGSKKEIRAHDHDPQAQEHPGHSGRPDVPVGTEVAVTDEFATGLRNAWTRVILVADARYHVREEDLAYARGEP